MYFSDSDAFRARKSSAYFKSILARIINDLPTQTVPEGENSVTSITDRTHLDGNRSPAEYSQSTVSLN